MSVNESKLPQYWYIENEYPEVREYLAKTYNVPEVLEWEHDYIWIGYDGCSCNNGVHGCDKNYIEHNARRISIEEFRECTTPKSITTYGNYAVALKNAAANILTAIKGDIFIKVANPNNWAFYKDIKDQKWRCNNHPDFKYFNTYEEANQFSYALTRNDEDLLKYANEHFIKGTKFISSFEASMNDRVLERTCEFWPESPSFQYEIRGEYPKRYVYCSGGMHSPEGGCSNPYMYSDEKGWVEITYDASLMFKPLKFEVGDWVVFEYDKAPEHLKTTVWNKSYILRVDEVKEDSLVFYQETAKKAGMLIYMGSCSNAKNCFRLAEFCEIPFVRIDFRPINLIKISSYYKYGVDECLSPEPEALKTTLSPEEDELPLVIPRVLSKVTNFLNIE